MVPAWVLVSVTSTGGGVHGRAGRGARAERELGAGGDGRRGAVRLSVNLGVRLSATPAPPDTAGYSTLYFCALDFSTLKVTVASSVVSSE